MKARFVKHSLQFTFAAGTSRGILREKTSWYVVLEENENFGIGECSPIWGLSPEKEENYEQKLNSICQDINKGKVPDFSLLKAFPTLCFGFETALRSLQSANNHIHFSSAFTQGESAISINGLIWMGDKSFMKEQISKKLAEGYRCLKMKIGAIDFTDELNLLKHIRKEFKEDELSIRLDANGAFKSDEALEKLKYLSDYTIHSIEQPIKEGQHEAMAALCLASPIAIALDEELINQDYSILSAIKPTYIILKPSLLGGINACNKWIDEAKKQGIAYWATSMLESNIGLSVIAQWAYTLQLNLPQGLGTGQLYHNNITSPLHISKALLYYEPGKKWDLSIFKK